MKCPGDSLQILSSGARVAFDTGPRLPRVHQQVCVPDQPIAQHNPTRKPARHAVVITNEASPWR